MLHHMNRAAAKVPSGSYVIRYSQTTDATTFTFNTSDIGAADNSRIIVVVVMASSTSTANRSLSSLTIGGVTATIHANVNNSRSTSIASLPVSTGTTSDIVVTMSGSCANCTIAIYRLINFAYASPQDVDSTSTSGATSLTRNITVSERAFVIAGVCGQASSTTATWTGVTEDFDVLVESGMRTTASDTMTAGNASYTVTCTASASIGMSLACLSWR